MHRVKPMSREELAEFEPIFEAMERSIGYVPNSFLTMGRDPLILKAVGALCDASWYTDAVNEPTRRLVTYAYSHFARSFYSSAHCACGAEEAGLSLAKIQSIDDYEVSSVLDDRERAIVRLCRHAARIPSEVTDRDVSEVKRHTSEATLVAIVGLICFIAYLNRWNELMSTTLEPVPRAFAEEKLTAAGWAIGAHR